MELTLRRNFDELIAVAEKGEPIPMEKRTLYRYQSSSVVRRCADLVDDLMPLLGGRAIYNSSPIVQPWLDLNAARAHVANDPNRSEEHTSELQSLMRISYAVFCLKKTTTLKPKSRLQQHIRNVTGQKRQS